MSNDPGRSVGQGQVDETVRESRLAIRRLMSDALAGFAEMDQLLERAEGLISGRAGGRVLAAFAGVSQHVDPAPVGEPGPLRTAARPLAA